MYNNNINETPRSRFSYLDSLPDRTNKISRARQYAQWTNPSLFTDQEVGEGTVGELSQNSQSIGSGFINSLSNKLSTSLLSLTRPFFRLKVDPKVVEDLIHSQVIKDKTTLDVELAQIEKKTVSQLDVMNLRPNLTHALQLSMVTGDVLIKIPDKGKDGKVKTFELRNYVVERSLDGTLLQIIIKEKIRFKALNEANQETVQATGMRPEDNENELDMYTRLYLDGERWRLEQSIDDAILDTTGSWNKDTFPYLVLPWSLRQGEMHGRGIIEDHAGDFAELERVSDSLSKVTAIISRIILLVNPNAMSSPQDLNAANDGDAVAGVESDFILLTFAEKLREVSFLSDRQKEIEQRLSKVFLVFTARDSERTTAEEVRRTANELESNLGGVFSSFAEGFQKPLAKILLDRIDFTLSDDIEPVIVTGLDSLSRNSELESVTRVIQAVAQLGGLPPEILETLKLDSIINTISSAEGIEPKTFVHTQEEIQASRQARQQQEQQAMQAQEAAKAASGIAQEQAKQ